MSLPRDEPVPERMGHVRIEGVAGHGGMGTVYVGYDERLLRRVAVKTLRRDRHASPGARERLLREARALSRLDHPGICRIHDVVELDGADVLMLEYVEGRSLAQVLAGPRLPRGEALRIGERLAEALAAAHREGVVHRDLKPENVMVTTSGEPRILDFGIARLLGAPAPASAESPDAPGAGADATERETAPLAAGRAAAEGTAVGAVIGTVRYMSPEQARGAEVAEPSDVFSLGLLLQELLTWRSPRRPESVTLDHVRFGDTAPCDELGPDLAALLAEMKSADAAARPSADAVAQRLRAIREAPRLRRRRHLRLAAVAGLLALVSATAVVSYRLARPPAIVPPGSHARLLVLPFHNGSGDPALDWTRHGLREIVAQSLERHEQLDVVPLGSLPQELGARALQGESPAPAELEALAEQLGQPLVLHAAVVRREAGTALAYRLYLGPGDPVTGQVEAGDPAQAARSLARAVSLRLVPEGPGELLDRLSADAYANLSYAIGLGEMDRTGPRAAQPYLEAAIARDPGFLAARLALARVLQAVGEGAESDRHAEAVRAAAKGLGDARLEAAALRNLGTNLQERGEHPRAIALLQQALARSREAGESYEAMETLNNLANTHYRTGALDEAEKAFEEVLREARRLGNRRREGGTLNNLGGIHYNRGDMGRAAELWRASLAVFRELGNRNLQAVMLGNLAVIESSRGDLGRAEAYERERLAIHRESGDRRLEAQGASNLSETLYARGDLAGARTLASEGLVAAQAAGDNDTEAFLRSSLAVYAAEAGEAEAARTQVETLLALADRLEAPDARVVAWVGAGLVHLAQGDPAAARALLTRARALGPEAPSVDVLEARLHAAAGRYRQALAALDRARTRGATWGPRWEDERARYARLAGL